MDEDKITQLNGIIDRLVKLSSEERTAALTQLYNLRTAAVEDLSHSSDSQRHWNTVLNSPSGSEKAQSLVRELVQLTDDELAIVSVQASERSNVAHEQALRDAGEVARARLQAQLAASAKQARESYNTARRTLDMEHKAKLAEKMKSVRDEIEEAVNTGQDVTTLEEVFDRIEQEFWEQYPSSDKEPRVKIEEE